MSRSGGLPAPLGRRHTSKIFQVVVIGDGPCCSELAFLTGGLENGVIDAMAAANPFVVTPLRVVTDGVTDGPIGIIVAVDDSAFYDMVADRRPAVTAKAADA